MGGNKDKEKANSMAMSRNTAAQTQFEGEQRQRSADAYARSNEAWGGANKTYQDFAATGGANLLEGWPGGGGSGGGGGGGGGGDKRFGDAEASYRKFMGAGGGVNQGRFNAFQGNLADIGKTGGWDPEAIANVKRSIKGYQNFADTGGLDAEAINRMRGLGIFDEFAKTGGISDAERANMRARGTSVIPAFYNRVREESNRLGRVQGGGGPGQAALMSRLARDEARGAQGAARDTEMGISEAVREGRQWGTQGLTSAEQTLQELLSRNKLAGMGGVADATGMMANSIAQNRTAASGAGAQGEIGMQGLITSNQLQGTRGLEGMANAAAARRASSGAASAADAKWRASFLADNMLAGAGGLRGLRTDVPGEVALYDSNRLQSRGLDLQAQGLYQGGEGGGVDWGQIAGAGANAAATYYGGQAGGGGSRDYNARRYNPEGYMS